MRLAWVVAAALLLIACEDRDFYSTPTPVGAGVVLSSTDSVDDGEVVAAQVARRGPDGRIWIETRGSLDEVVVPSGGAEDERAWDAFVRDNAHRGTPVPAPPQRPSPTLNRRAAATATARAALERVVRPGTQDEARRARQQREAVLGDATRRGTGAGVSPADLARTLNGLPLDQVRCDDLALAERNTRTRREAGLPVAGAPETEIVLQQLEAGCFPADTRLTPELARALVARRVLDGAGADPGGAAATGRLGADLGRLDAARTTDRRAGAADRFAREDDLGAPGLAPLPPRAPLAQERPVTSRPPFRDTLRPALGTGP